MGDIGHSLISRCNYYDSQLHWSFSREDGDLHSSPQIPEKSRRSPGIYRCRRVYAQSAMKPLPIFLCGVSLVTAPCVPSPANRRDLPTMRAIT